MAWLNSFPCGPATPPEACPLAQGCPVGPTGVALLPGCRREVVAVLQSEGGSARLDPPNGRGRATVLGLYWAPSHGLGCSS